MLQEPLTGFLRRFLTECGSSDKEVEKMIKREPSASYLADKEILTCLLSAALPEAPVTDRCFLADWVAEYLIDHGVRVSEPAVCQGSENGLPVGLVALPDGKPGDYLEWDNGAGFNQIYCINAVMIFKDCLRYDLGKFAPCVNHKNIVRIIKQEDMLEAVRERLGRSGSNGERKDGDGNG